MHLTASRTRSSRLIRGASCAIVAISIFVVGQRSASGQPQRTQPEARDWTVRLDRGQTQPFYDAFFAFDGALEANKGKAPAGAARRLDELVRLSQPARAAVRTFVAALRQAGQEQAFEAQVYAAAGKTGQPTLVADLRQAGGPLNILRGFDRFADDLLADRRDLVNATGSGGWLDALGLSVTVHAGARGRITRLGCSLALYVLTRGDGTEANYRLCGV